MFTAGYSLVARVCVLWRGGAGEQPWSSRGGPGGQGVSQCECRAFGFQHCMQYTQVRRCCTVIALSLSRHSHTIQTQRINNALL